VRYRHGSASLLVECAECGKAVVEFALSVREA
jgi:hypothetical protein